MTIYTVTLNPALDYVVSVPHFTLGKLNRTEEEHIFCGGKGLNVSAVLVNLGFETKALGFVAGFTGNELERQTGAMGIQADFVHVRKGMTRINVKLKSDEETELNGMGPEITAADEALLMEKLDKLQNGDVLVLSGSIPPTVDNHIYERMARHLGNRRVLLAVDAAGELLLNTLPYKPFLIKPNRNELEEIFDVKLHGPEEILAYGVRLQKMGARNVLVSMGGDGAMLIDENQKVYTMGTPQGIVKNSVGAGDSMVAGFIAGYISTGDYQHALRLGTAAGSATAFSYGIAGKAEIMELMERSLK